MANKFLKPIKVPIIIQDLVALKSVTQVMLHNFLCQSNPCNFIDKMNDVFLFIGSNEFVTYLNIYIT